MRISTAPRSREPSCAPRSCAKRSSTKWIFRALKDSTPRSCRGDIARRSRRKAEFPLATTELQKLPWIAVEDFKLAGGWTRPEQREARSRTWCELLERGQILFFRDLPFELPAADRDFLVAQQWAELRMHKNVSYRPGEDVLRGVSGDPATAERVHSILRNYSTHLIDFLKSFLMPYAGKWSVDFSSFRPFEEERRGLPLHKRNDLLHVDAFPSRPTRGGR